jgi:hypothetical protein
MTCKNNARLVGENVMELICVPWTFLVTLGGLGVLCAAGWALTVHRWHVAAQALLRQLEEISHDEPRLREVLQLLRLQVPE